MYLWQNYKEILRQQKNCVYFLENTPNSYLWLVTDYFPWCSSDTVNFLRPLARREANTRRPFFVAMRSRKPCLLTRRRLCGWNVLFIVLSLFYFVEIRRFGLQNYIIISNCASFFAKFLISHFSFLIFFVSLHPEKVRNCSRLAIWTSSFALA